MNTTLPSIGTIDHCIDTLNKWKAEAEKDAKERAEMVAKLERYERFISNAHHNPICEWNDLESPLCTCGLSAAREALKGTT